MGYAVFLFCLSAGLAGAAIGKRSCHEHKGATITNNGYEDIRIRIDSMVPEDKAIIDHIKTVFTKASGPLFTALNQRGYFKSIRIVVPSTWSADPSYADADSRDLNQQVNEFLVADHNPYYGDTPFVKRSYSECGREGDYVHLTPRYLAKAIGKEIVQKFAEQRFGIFPEYYNTHKTANIYSNYPFDTRVCQANFDPSPTTCPQFTPSGKSDRYTNHGDSCHPCPKERSFDTNTPPPECHDYYHKYSGEEHTSLLFTAREDQVYKFCDDHSHNRFARNEHNSRCNMRSAWSVIGANVDFSSFCTGGGGEPNPPNPKIHDTTPQFTVVQNTDPRALTFVLDVSSSMSSGTPSRINVLHQAVTAAIECMDVGEKVGIVAFSNTASTTLALTPITDEASRRRIRNSVPDNTEYNTCIGCGLLQGINVLKGTKGARIVLISDGEENERPLALSPTVQRAIGQAHVSIDTIRISPQASDVLLTLAKKWSGTAFLLNTQSVSWHTAMQQAVSQLCQLTRPTDRPGDTVEILSVTTSGRTGHVYIDSTIGDNTVFLFLASQQNLRISVVLTQPDGTKIDSTSTYYEEINNGQQISIRIPKAQSGNWGYEISRSFAAVVKYNAVLPETPSNLDCPLGQERCDRSADAKPSVEQQPLANHLDPNPEVTSANADSVAILVTSKSIDSKNPLTVKTTYSYTSIIDVTKQPLLIFTTVQIGHSPVLNVDVVTHIIDPAGSEHNVTLLDDGQGPDDQASDGVYSGYFSNFSSITTYGEPQGFQAVTTASANNQTYYVNATSDKRTPLHSFERSINNPTFYVTLDKSQKDKDTIPPSRIGDFAAVDVDTENQTVKLSWTAVGKDYDVGTASKYMLKSSYNYTEIVGNFASLPSVDKSLIRYGGLDPKPSGQEMSVAVGPFANDSVAYFAIEAVDNSGNISPLSRVAAVNFTAPPTPGMATSVVCPGLLATVLLSMALIMQ